MMKTAKVTTGTLMMLTVFLTAMLMGGCSASSSNDIDLVNNEQQREEVFNQILENEELFDEFMERMMDSSGSMHWNWMMGHRGFMEHMFDEDNLDYMMNHLRGMDRYMMQNMMDMMGRDTSLYRQWYEMMDEHHMMGGYGHMHR